MEPHLEGSSERGDRYPPENATELVLCEPVRVPPRGSSVPRTPLHHRRTRNWCRKFDCQGAVSCGSIPAKPSHYAKGGNANPPGSVCVLMGAKLPLFRWRGENSFSFDAELLLPLRLSTRVRRNIPNP